MSRSKDNSKYKTIGEVARILNLVSQKNGSFSTHTIRFWEKEFKQIKPKILTGNRRYYDDNAINMLKKIKYLLKDKGMTLNGVKKVLNSKDSEVDELINISIKRTDFVKSKIKTIKNLITNIKNRNG